jgi:thioredoxin 2
VATTTTARVIACATCGRKNRVPAVAAGAPHCGNCQGPLAWIADAGENEFPDVAERSTLPVVVDLWAPWCGPCRTVGPALEQVAQELAGRIKLVKVDIDKAPHLAARFAVQAVPTLLVLRGSEVLARQAGAAPAPALRRWIDDVLGLSREGRTSDRPR